MSLGTVYTDHGPVETSLSFQWYGTGTLRPLSFTREAVSSAQKSSVSIRRVSDVHRPVWDETQRYDTGSSTVRVYPVGVHSLPRDSTLSPSGARRGYEGRNCRDTEVVPESKG